MKNKWWGGGGGGGGGGPTERRGSMVKCGQMLFERGL